MAFDINKARTSQDNGRGRFDIEKARNSGQPTSQPAPQPLKANVAFDALRDRQKKRELVRLPFSQRQSRMGGANNAFTRGFLNIASRSMEDIVVAGFKVAATIKGSNIETNRPIVNEPNLTGGDVDVQTTFEPMSRAAVGRIEELDVQRPDKRFLNLLQGSTEEVFLPLLNAVDIVGLTSLAVRLTRKVTLSKGAQEAFSDLNMGLMSDTSETGIRTHIATEIQKNVDLLANEKITPQVYTDRMNRIGTSLDTLTEAPTTRFGTIGDKLNAMSTALEMERKIGRATDPTFIQTRNALNEAMNKAEVPTPVKQVDVEKATPTEEAIAKGLTEDEFVKGQGDSVFHGTPKDFVSNKSGASSIEKRGLNFTKDGIYGSAQYTTRYSGDAKLFGGRALEGEADVVELKLSSNVKLYEYATDSLFTDLDEVGKLIRQSKGKENGEQIKAMLLKEGYDGVDHIGREVAIYNPDVLKTTSQLRAEYQAAKVKQPAIASKATVAKKTDERPKSKLALRINESLPDGNKIDEFYDAITIKGELDEAGKAITKNPTKALTEALDGGQSLPKRAARLMEFAQAAKDRGDTAVQSALLSKMRVLGTDIAQGLNMFKAFGLSNPETEFLETIMAARLRKIEITAEDISRAGSPSKAYNAKVYAPVKKEVDSVTKKAFKVEDAQKLFDDLSC